MISTGGRFLETGEGIQRGKVTEGLTVCNRR
jgi:hypothetical protein